MTSKLQGFQQTWKRPGQASKPLWTVAIPSHMIDTLAVCTGSLRTSGCLHRHTHLHSPLKPRSQQQHSTEHRTGGSTMKPIRHGSVIMYNPENDCTSRVMRGESLHCQNSSRITFFDKKVTPKGCPSITDGNNQGGYDVATDDWKTSSNQANEFWTGKTVFCYGQDGPHKFKQFAMASKARPGSHRDKREAKKEAKASKFRGVGHAVKSKAGVMAMSRYIDWWHTSTVQRATFLRVSLGTHSTSANSGFSPMQTIRVNMIASVHPAGQ